MEDNFRSHPDLDDIARYIHLSPYHFQRLFLDWVGLTPKKFLQYLTVDYLKNSIHASRNVMEAADMAGLSSQSRVYDLFVKIEGMTPQQFKSAGEGLQITYGYHPTPLGMCFLAVSPRGICELHFIDGGKQRNAASELAARWPFATLVHEPACTQRIIQRIFADKPQPEKLELFVQGSPFEIKVWEALVNIPFGHATTYEALAGKLGCPGGARAVASAAGRNPITYLIPCHRLITKAGQTGNFQQGRIRKKIILSWEMSSLSAPDDALQESC